MSQVDGRTCAQWLKSAIAYCDWRSGASWRRFANVHEKWACLDYNGYLDAIRLLTKALNTPEESTRLHVALPVLNPAPTPTQEEKTLAALPRVALVSRLMELDASLTDRKLLLHLGKAKLAGMLSERLAKAAAAEPARMRA